MRDLLRPRLRRVVALAVIASVGLLAVLTVQANGAAAAALDRYSVSQSQLDAELQQARQQGYTDDDLAPITTRAIQAESQGAPLIPQFRASFYASQSDALEDLRFQLRGQEEIAVDDARAAASAGIQQTRDQLSQDDRLGVDPDQLQPLEKDLAKLSLDETAAKLPRDYLKVKSQVDQVNTKAVQLGKAQSAENAAMANQAKELEVKQQFSLPGIRRTASNALFRGRNDASVASFMGMSLLDGAYRQLEHYATLLRSNNPDQAALGAVGVRHFSDLIHKSLLGHLPRKAILVSLSGQELVAYQNGSVVLDSLVTTGRPELPTDVGAMHVLFKSSPWKMHSPWPKHSVWWYPDTWVKMAIFFTDTGESMHDASWQPDGTYGPGSQYVAGIQSHGCIHVPYGNEVQLYAWAEDGTPVIVYPGDGSQVSSQVAQITVDSNGQPVTGPRGV